jgi:hypothetical protein
VIGTDFRSLDLEERDRLVVLEKMITPMSPGNVEEMKAEYGL